jgi:16S rRNA (guanine966-N2)-methyltransferase
MSIKILGGVARGFLLAAPRSDSTRPTSVLVRRKLFDWRQHLDGEVFIDLCSGSGAMGLEALSRGAEKVYLNDALKGAFLTLKQNSEKFLKSFEIETSQITISSLDALKWIQKEMPYQLRTTENAIIFLDPPYENHLLYTEALKLLKEAGYAGEVWVESDRMKGPKKETLTGAFHSIIKIVEQGDHFVVVGKVV